MNIMRCFHSNLTGIQAEELLKSEGKDGSFLCRPSGSQSGDFSLSVRRGDEVTHIKIQNYGECYDLYGGEKFASLPELIQHYLEKNEILKEKSGEVIELKQPLNCKNPITERWFHGSVTGKEAEVLLSDKSAEAGSFLVRESQTQPGNYVLSVRQEENVVGQDEKTIMHIKVSVSPNGSFDIGGRNSFNNLSDLIEEYRSSPLVFTDGTLIKLKQPLNTSQFYISRIRDRIDKLNGSACSLSKNGFLEEFEQLGRYDIKDKREEGKKLCNKSKNRYKNILPYDRTRVILHDGGITEGDDYINANYIRISKPYLHNSNGGGDQVNDILSDSDKLSININLNDEPIYISSQGCLMNTIPDFWRMVWQEKSYLIVMTTKEVERTKKKCAPYWPKDINEVMECEIPRGKINLKLLKKHENDIFICRSIQMTRSDSNEIRNVTQYQFLAWPDHGTPQDAGAVLDLLTKIDELKNSNPSGGPIIVHCSAGIGRTGTFVAIHILIKQIESGEQLIDIQKVVQQLRSQRSGMVQTEAQYQFVYKALKYYHEVNNVKLQAQKAAMEAGRDYTNVQYTPTDLSMSSTSKLDKNIRQVPNIPKRNIPPTPRQHNDEDISANYENSSIPAPVPRRQPAVLPQKTN